MKAGSVLSIEESREVKGIPGEILVKDGYAVMSTCDLIISDMGDPGMDGVELPARFRKNSINTPVPLTSGVKICNYVRAGSDFSSTRLLCKPFKIKEIKRLSWTCFRENNYQAM